MSIRRNFSVFPRLTAASLIAVAFFQNALNGEVIRVQTTNQVEIQRAIDRLPSSGGTVVLVGNRTISVSESIVINRDNVTLEGEGQVELRLADGANHPVVVIGQVIAEPTVLCQKVRIRNLRINGNRTAQTSERDPKHRELRNNGISIRRAQDCSIERVTTFACRSGGLVTEFGCRDLRIRDFDSFDNEFDGLACYATEESEFSNLKLHSNLAAGLSMDLDCVRNLISDSVISSNRSSGVFIRDSRDNRFVNLQIRDSGSHGIFLAQVDRDTSTPASGNVFRRCIVAGSGAAGVRVNDASCVENALTHMRFEGNRGGNISEAVAGQLQIRSPLAL